MLIADDDVDAWFQVNALLRRHFIKANFVTNLSAAKQIIDRVAPSLLFFGKQLQDHSTPDLIRYARARYPFIKIIMGYSHGDGPAAYKSNADLLICKPLVPEMIERAITNLLFPRPQLS